MRLDCLAPRLTGLSTIFYLWGGRKVFFGAGSYNLCHIPWCEICVKGDKSFAPHEGPVGVLRVMFDKNTRVTVGKVVVVSLDGFAPRLARLKHNFSSMVWAQGFVPDT